MPEISFHKPEPPYLIVCDDIRREVGGKRTLVGVYPQNVVTVPNPFPRTVTVRTWTGVRASNTGAFVGHLRIARSDDRAVLFKDDFNANVVFPHTIVPGEFLVSFEIQKPGRLELQVQAEGDKAWLSLGSFEVVGRDTP